MANDKTAPLTFTCPVGGEVWPATAYRSFVDASKPEITLRSVTFICAADHSFSLAKALKSKMFTKEQAARILTEAKRLAAGEHRWHNAGKR
jgi:hypothetical protein